MNKTAHSRPPGAETDRNCFRIEFIDEQGGQLHEFPLSAGEFDRAICAAHFAAFRSGVFDTYAPQLSAARIEPRFLGHADRVNSEGFRVCLPTPAGNDFVHDFPLNYFQPRVATLRASLRLGEKPALDSCVNFRLGAYLEDEVHSGTNEWRPSFEPASFCVPIRKVARAEFANSQPWDHPDDGELPVLIDRSLVEDGCAEAVRNPDREVGGLLLGNLCQDPETGAVFLLVNCLVSAEGTTQATATSVTFSPESFARARELIRIRARPGEPPEILVGWFHSHPFRFCKQCPLPVPTECIQKVLFYSADDVQLMESTFPQPFMIGLLAAVEPRLSESLGHLPVKLFGWRQGEVMARGFEVLDE